VAEQSAGVIEEHEQNALVRTAIMTGLEPGHQVAPATDRALPAQLGEGDLVAHRGERAVHPLEGQLEFEGEAGTTELLVGVLAEERQDVIDSRCH